jgi:hypothetical protein
MMMMMMMMMAVWTLRTHGGNNRNHFFFLKQDIAILHTVYKEYFMNDFYIEFLKHL